MSSLAYKLPQESQERPESRLPLVRPRALKPQYTVTPLLRRETEAVSPSAIFGFLLACALVVLFLLGHIQLDRVNDQTARLSTELSALQDEYEDLSAQYEQLYDMDSIKSDLMASGAMMQVSSEQQIYMDLSQPDSTTVYEGEEESEVTPLSAFFALVTELFN